MSFVEEKTINNRTYGNVWLGKGKYLTVLKEEHAMSKNHDCLMPLKYVTFTIPASFCKI